MRDGTGRRNHARKEAAALAPHPGRATPGKAFIVTPLALLTWAVVILLCVLVLAICCVAVASAWVAVAGIMRRHRERKGVQYVPVAKLKPDPNNPRRHLPTIPDAPLN